MITRVEFEQGFRSLCLAFGISYSEGRCAVYHEHLQKLGKEDWQAVVSRWKNGGSAFPKISDLVKTREFERATEKPKADELAEWLGSDCVAKECIEGLVPVGEYKGSFYPLFGPEAPPQGVVFDREVSYRCTKCRRGDAAYPKMALWRGAYSIRGGEEMMKRSQERKEIAAAGGKSLHKVFGGVV